MYVDLGEKIKFKDLYDKIQSDNQFLASSPGINRIQPKKDTNYAIFILENEGCVSKIRSYLGEYNLTYLENLPSAPKKACFIVFGFKVENARQF